MHRPRVSPWSSPSRRLVLGPYELQIPCGPRRDDPARRRQRRRPRQPLRPAEAIPAAATANGPGARDETSGLHGSEWLPAAVVFRLTGHHGGTEPNGSYISPPVTRRSRALLIMSAGQPPREDR